MVKWICDKCDKHDPCMFETIYGFIKPKYCPLMLGEDTTWEKEE